MATTIGERTIVILGELEPHEAVTAAELAARLPFPRQSVQASLYTLMAAGYVERIRDPERAAHRYHLAGA